MAKRKYTVHGQLDPYQELANAIVVQAAKDYRSALRRLKKNPENKRALATKNEVEEFFLSEWYELLTDVDGTYLMRKLREEADANDS